MLTIRYTYTGEGLAGFDRFATHPPEFLLNLYFSMLRIRRIEEEIERRYHQDQMKTPIHLVIGQEATSVGCCAALTTADLLYSSHRTHGNYLGKGGDLKAMLCEMHCRVNGCAGSRGGSMHLIDKKVGMAGTSAIVGGAVPIAVGAALAARMKGEPHVVVVFIGDATTEEGVASESLNFAALKRVPVISSASSFCSAVALAARQPERTSRLGGTYGMPSRSSGVNVLAVYEATRTTGRTGAARRSPAFMEAPVYRFPRTAAPATTPHRLPRRGRASAGSRPGTGSAGVSEPRRHRDGRNRASREFHARRPTREDLYRHVYAD